LTPFVTNKIEKHELVDLIERDPTSGEAYLEKWKVENGQD